MLNAIQLCFVCSMVVWLVDLSIHWYGRQQVACCHACQGGLGVVASHHSFLQKLIGRAVVLGDLAVGTVGCGGMVG